MTPRQYREPHSRHTKGSVRIAHVAGIGRPAPRVALGRAGRTDTPRRAGRCSRPGCPGCGGRSSTSIIGRG
jgi:hypothetical protein